MRTKLFTSSVLAVTLVTGCGGDVKHQPPTESPTNNAQVQLSSQNQKYPNLPKPDHIVVVIEENHSRAELKGNPDAPYLNSLFQSGAFFNHSHGIEHPSQPNYLDLFSGANQGVTSDSCPHRFSAPNLASELMAHRMTFTGYAEDLPSVGYTGCTNAKTFQPWTATYARKHSPWVNFTNVPSSANRPFSEFPSDYSMLPTVAFVIPNLQHDMHNGTVAEADKWLKTNLGPYVTWAQKHNSLLIVTWDEDDKSESNVIPTVFVGPMVHQGVYEESINHFTVLRTIEDMYALPYLGRSAQSPPIIDAWNG